MLVLCDSGILLRLFEPTDPLHDIVRDSASALQARGDKLATAPQNLAGPKRGSGVYSRPGHLAPPGRQAARDAATMLEPGYGAGTLSNRAGRPLTRLRASDRARRL
jgi:hypothetical protein